MSCQETCHYGMCDGQTLAHQDECGDCCGCLGGCLLDWEESQAEAYALSADDDIDALLLEIRDAGDSLE